MHIDKTLIVDVSRDSDKVRISCHEEGGSISTVIPYGEVTVDEKKIEKYKNEITALLNRANQPGRTGRDIVSKLKATGQVLYDELLSVDIKKRLKEHANKNLVISTDDHMVDLPWELLFNGDSFLCLLFNLGRRVKTRQSPSVNGSRPLAIPLKMLILTDPTGDLPSAREEGKQIREVLRDIEQMVSVTSKNKKITSAYVTEKIREFDIVHYAGHSDYDRQNPEQGGWILNDNKLAAKDIIKMRGSGHMPSLVFANSCQSGHTQEWKNSENGLNQVYGMANAFLLTGVRHYIGTFWEVQDKSSATFAEAFYTNLANGLPIGECVRSARERLINEYGEEELIWASYMLYGDPGTFYNENIATLSSPSKEKKFGTDRGIARSAGSISDASHTPEKKKISFYPLLLTVALVLGGASALFSYMLYKPSLPHQQEYDAWRSRKMVLSLLAIDTPGTGQGESSALLTKIATNLSQSKRFQMVERAMIKKILAELNLNESEKMAPEMALRVGKLIGARFIGIGSLYVNGKEASLTLRIIETETSSIAAMATHIGSESDLLQSAADAISEDIRKQMVTSYPLRGGVIAVTNDMLTLDIGKELGVRPNMKFRILQEKEILDKEGKRVAIEPIEVGTVRIEKTIKTLSYGKILLKAGELSNGLKAEELF